MNSTELKSIEKEIDSIRDSRNHLWHALMLNIGGTAALVFNLDSFIKWIFLIIGFYLCFIFANGYFVKDEEIILN